VKLSSPLPKSKKPARTKLLEGELDLAQVTPESRKHAACVLEVLAGLRSPEQAAEVLSMSLPTYYNLETRALRGLIHGCTPTPPGRTLILLKQVRSLELKSAALEKQVGRYQALLRNAQRSAGLLPPPAQAPGKTPGRRKHRPVVRALRAIEVLQRDRAPGREEPVEPPTSSSPGNALVVR
jgi:hypothetical protein